MRVKVNGAYVTDAPEAITNITQAVPGRLTIPAHGYSSGDWIFITGVLGMTEFNGLVWIVDSVVNANNVTVTDLFGVSVDTHLLPAYISGGTAARIYTLTTPYAAVDLPYLKFTESADTMSLCLVNQATLTEYAPYELQRFAANNWTLTQPVFGSAITAPTGVAATATSSTTLSTFYAYVVTAVDGTTGEESVASQTAIVQNNDIAINAGSNTITWNPVANAGSYNIYKATPSYQVPVPAGVIFGYAGSAYGTSFTDTNITADFTTVPPLHTNPFARSAITAVTPTASGSALVQGTTGFSITTGTGTGFDGAPLIVNGSFVAFLIVNGGRGYLPADTIALGTRASGTITFAVNPTNGDTTTLNGVVWTFVTGAAGASQTSIGTTLALTLAALVQNLNASVAGGLIVATYSTSATVLTITYDVIGAGGNAYTLAASAATPSGGNLTGGSTATGATATLTIGPATGTYPGVVAYFQQRRVYAQSLNNPDTYWMSQPGAFLNFDTATPVIDSDAITGSPWAEQINGIQWMVPMPGGLVILTGRRAWQVNGGNSAAITPADQNASPQSFQGASATVPPIVVNFDVIYPQAKRSIPRDLSYNFFVNIYTGVDLSVISSHLFANHTITQWAWAEEPYKLIWAIRDDGVMLAQTYLKEQDIYAWSRHDTNGLFVGVCSITEQALNHAGGAGPELVDAVYVIVKRFVRGTWVYYSERMDDRDWGTNVEQAWCVDAGLSLPQPMPAATLTASSATGTGDVGQYVIIDGGTGYTLPAGSVLNPPGGTGSGAAVSLGVAAGVITTATPAAPGSGYVPPVTVTVLDATGSGAKVQPIVTNYVTFTSSPGVFSSADEGSIIRMGGGAALVAEYVAASAGTQVIASLIWPITATVPNDPDNTPIPAAAGQWTISPQLNVMSGLNHLEGKTVAILADGSVLPSQTVVNGAITLPQPASLVVVGLPYTCQLQALYLEPPGQPETVQSRRKNVTSVAVRIEASRGLKVGSNQPDQSTQAYGAAPPWTGLREIKERSALTTAGVAIPLFTGDEYINIDSDWDVKGQVAVEQDYPLPANILSVVAYFAVGDTVP